MGQRLFTRADYEAMPDEWRGELVGGVLVMSPPPVPYHQHLVTDLLVRIHAYLGEQSWRALVAPVNVDVDDHNVFQPDIVILPETCPPPTLDWELPLPIWVIEVLSPSTARHDEEVKLLRLAEAGVREAWLIAPRARQIVTHDLARGTQETVGIDGVAESIAVEGFRLSVAELFRI